MNEIQRLQNRKSKLAQTIKSKATPRLQIKGQLKLN